MKPVDFDYERPATLDAVCRRLAESAGEAKIIAGGQTLVPLLAMRLARPALLLDINGIADLKGIAAEDGIVTIGACTRQAAALADATVRLRLPLLAKALAFVGHGQTRNRGTVGGSIANADPAAEIGLAALALDGEVRVRSARGARVIAIREFFRAAMETALEPDECLTHVRLPVWRDPAIGTGFQELSVRQSDFALAAVAVQVALEGGVCRRAAIAVGGAETMPARMGDAETRLVGTRLAPRDLAEAGTLAARALPAVVGHAGARYRARVVASLVERALGEAKAEAA